MKRNLVMTVAGTRLRVQVRAVGPEIYEVQVEDLPAVRVQRRAQGLGTSQWSWHEGHRVCAALVDGGAGRDLRVDLRQGEVAVRLEDPRKAMLTELGLEAPRGAQGPVELRSPMPGRVVKVLVEQGDAVKEGQALLVVEAMKMENEMRAPRDARVVALAVKEGAAVEAGARLLVLE